MTKQELWNAYVAKNPKFADENAEVTLTARGLKKLFEQTYDHGYEKGKVVGETIGGIRSSFSDPFGMFRGL